MGYIKFVYVCFCEVEMVKNISGIILIIASPLTHFMIIDIELNKQIYIFSKTGYFRSAGMMVVKIR